MRLSDSSRPLKVPAAVRLVQTVLASALVVYVASLVLREDTGYNVVFEGWIANFALALGPVLCFTRAILVPEKRPAFALLGFGGLLFTAGHIAYVARIQYLDPLPFPNLADIGYLGAYPFFVAALVLLARAEVGAKSVGVYLDGLVGVLGVAAVGAAVVLHTTLRGLSGDIGALVVGASYPLADLLLLSIIVGVLTVLGRWPDRQWTVLAAGLGIFAVGDMIFLLRLSTNSYVQGTYLDALFVVGLPVISLSAWQRARAPEEPRTGSPGSLAVAMVSSVVAIGVLVAASFIVMESYAVALAAATLLAGLIRTIVALRQIRQLAEARHQATTDDLTGLPNRRAFTWTVETAVATASAERGFALLLVDLDRFKEVNDLLGHHIGDRLLREIGPRLSPMLRACDVLGRLGGDEFGVVLPGADETTAVGIARRLCDALADPFVLEGMSQPISGSVGVALWPTHSDNAQGLLQCADIAMYAAKSHRTGVGVYDPVHGTEGRTRLAMAKQLTLALNSDQFVLHYQPKLDLRTGDVVGVEALVRWQHPDLGLLYPDAFLPIAEQVGCMDLLTRMVLAAAVAQGRQWRLDGLDLSVAVNLSASNLVNDELVRDIAMILARENFPAASLTLEITESTLMSDGPRALATLDAIHDLGIALSVDDFGTGFSSLTYIRDLPVQELKIDRTFVTGLTTPSRDATIVKSTIDLAHALDLQVVAEGIENAEAQTVLTQLGCDLAQGYHLGRPKGADELTAWLRTRPVRTMADWVVPTSE